MGDDVGAGTGSTVFEPTRLDDSGRDGSTGTATRPRPPHDPPGRRPVSGGPGKSGKRRSIRAPYGWWPLVVIMSVALVDRLESSVLSAILVDLQAEWGFSDTAGGMLSAAISISGTALALPAGYLADRANRKNLLAIIVALWSFITLGSGVSVGFGMFFATRLALAAADSIDNPSQVSLLADYYSVEVRPKVLGFHRMITFAGGALGTLYGGVVTQLWGWRAVFYTIIVPGLVVAWWCYRLHEPRRGEADARTAAAGLGGEATVAASDNGHRAPGHAEVKEIATAEGGVVGEVATADGSDGRRQPTGAGVDEPDASGFDTVNLTQAPGIKALFSQIKTVLRIRTIVLVYAGLGALFFGLKGIFFWLPTFYQRQFELDPGPAATITAAITLFGVVGGTWIGGVIGERVHGRLKGGRVLAGGSGIVVGSMIVPVSLQSSTLTGQALFLGVAVTFMSIAIPNLQSSIADALPGNQRGVGFSLLGIFTTFGAFGPMLVGTLSDATGSLVTAFGFLLVPMVLGGVVTIVGRSTFDRDVQRALDAVVTAAGQGAGTASPSRDDSAPAPSRSGQAVSEEEMSHGVDRTRDPEEPVIPDGAATAARETLSGIRGLGPAKVATLVEHFGTLEAIRAADVAELVTVPGIGPGLAAAIKQELSDG